jgi:hypothetical protein
MTSIAFRDLCNLLVVLALGHTRLMPTARLLDFFGAFFRLVISRGHLSFNLRFHTLYLNTSLTDD